MATHDHRITNYSYIHSHKDEDFQTFLDTINPKDGDVILEAFCGYGETTGKLIERERSMKISCEHYLSDASQTQIDRAHQAHSDNKSVKSIILADARTLPYTDGMFDIVVVKMGLHETNKKTQTAIMKELFRVLKKGGRFVTWEIALLNDVDSQKIFRKVIYRKNELAGFYEINRNRYFQKEKDLLLLFKKTGFKKCKKVHDIWYKFESIRRKEEMVSVERKFLIEAKKTLNKQEETFLEHLSQYRLDEFNKSIKEMIPVDKRNKLQYKEATDDNIQFMAHKAIFEMRK